MSREFWPQNMWSIADHGGNVSATKRRTRDNYFPNWNGLLGRGSHISTLLKINDCCPTLPVWDNVKHTITILLDRGNQSTQIHMSGIGTVRPDALIQPTRDVPDFLAVAGRFCPVQLVVHGRHGSPLVVGRIIEIGIVGRS
jgi:hypothetical protein